MAQIINYGYLKQTWDGLLAFINNEYGVAGLMGNLYAESGVIPFRVQGDYTYPFTYSSDYTARVDNGTVSEYSFVNLAPDSTHAKGYGMAQWTSQGRKQNLYNFYKNVPFSSIGGLDLALYMLQFELSGSYAPTLAVLQSATDIATASDYVLIHFEAPKDQSEAVKILRRDYSQQIYDLYNSGGGQPDPPTPTPPPPPYPPTPTEPSGLPVWMMCGKNRFRYNIRKS